jgi:Uma2 family endonuclease
MGVRECWLVSPEAETLEVVSLSAQGTEVVDIIGVDGSLRSGILEEFTLDLGEVFR